MVVEVREKEESKKKNENGWGERKWGKYREAREEGEIKEVRKRGGAGGEVWVGEKNGRKIRKENGLEANFEIYEWIMIS